jgi:hypothetical protein
MLAGMAIPFVVIERYGNLLRTDAGRRYRTGDPIRDSACHDAGTFASADSGLGPRADELTGDLAVIESGPFEESASMVGESGQRALSVVAHRGELGGAAVNDGARL